MNLSDFRTKIKRVDEWERRAMLASRDVELSRLMPAALAGDKEARAEYLLLAHAGCTLTAESGDAK